MELEDFVKHYLPDYEDRLRRMESALLWYDRKVSQRDIDKFHIDHFKEAYYQFIKNK